MEGVVSLLKNKRSQDVRLPVNFEFDTKKGYVRKEANGDVVLPVRSKRQSSWDKMWEALDEINESDFLTQEERRQDVSSQDPFDRIT
ncbi:antitoxin [Rodentibacter haemolyticus]|nr:AbrB/MazE/SpoVT family DNA-binding domain-containing protein [Rodentibacter haemolyticus]